MGFESDFNTEFKWSGKYFHGTPTHTLAAYSYILVQSEIYIELFRPLGVEYFLCLIPQRSERDQMIMSLSRDRNAHISEPFFIRHSGTVPSEDPDTAILLSIDITAHYACNTSQSYVT